MLSCRILCSGDDLNHAVESLKVGVGEGVGYARRLRLHPLPFTSSNVSEKVQSLEDVDDQHECRSGDGATGGVVLDQVGGWLDDAMVLVGMRTLATPPQVLCALVGGVGVTLAFRAIRWRF